MFSAFQDRCLKPLGHPSVAATSITWRREDQERRGNLRQTGPTFRTAHEHNWPAMVVERSFMGIACVDERRTALAVGALLLLSLSLGGCATSTGSSLMDARADASVPPT